MPTREPYRPALPVSARYPAIDRHEASPGATGRAPTDDEPGTHGGGKGVLARQPREEGP